MRLIRLMAHENRRGSRKYTDDRQWRDRGLARIGGRSPSKIFWRDIGLPGRSRLLPKQLRRHPRDRGRRAVARIDATRSFCFTRRSALRLYFDSSTLWGRQQFTLRLRQEREREKNINQFTYPSMLLPHWQTRRA
jgi:hypothetical protein